MKIQHLAAGAGGMYCGSCLHGNTLAAALRAAGEDVSLVPLYTPLRTDEEDVSMPTVYRESKGLPVLEAWANAVPVVLPAHGAFPEMIQDTGGGLLCEPGDPQSLAAALKRMIREPDLAAECGRRAQQAVHTRHNAEVMARRTIEVYRACPTWKTCR